MTVNQKKIRREMRMRGRVGGEDESSSSRVKMKVRVKVRASDAGSLPLQCWARVRIYPPTKGRPSSNNSPNSPNRSSPRMAPQMSLHLPSTVKTSPSPTCFIFFNQNGASMNATATSGRSSALRCGSVARHYLILPFHSFTFLQARIALLEGERRSFENTKVDLMRRIKMLEYALRVERFVPILSSTAYRALTRSPRAAQSNSHNPALTHPSRSPPQRLLLCSPPPRRTRHLAIRKLAVPAPLVAKVFRFLFIPFFC
jgi:Striatin family